jgi:hypothetical protein
LDGFARRLGADTKMRFSVQQKSGPEPASLRLRDLRSTSPFVVTAPSTGTNNRLKLGDLTDHLSRPSRTKEAVMLM